MGQFDLKIDTHSFDAHDTAFRIFAGWRFTRVLAFELAYADLGSPEHFLESYDLGFPSVSTRTSATGFAPYAVTTAPLGAFELYAKLGYFFYDFELTVHQDFCDLNPSFCTNPTLAAKQRDEGFTYALGMGTLVLDRFDIRLEYESFDISGVEDDASTYWASAAWRF